MMQAKYLAESAEMEGSQFSLSQQEQTAKGALLENATDVKVWLMGNILICG